MDRAVFWGKILLGLSGLAGVLWMVWLCFNAPFEDDDGDV